MPRRQSLQLQQTRLSYLEQGTPEPGQPSFVLIHGLMGTAATFIPLMNALPPERHVIAIDLPGAGDSDRGPDVSSHLRSISQSVSGILHALELKTPVLVGHSHGGAVALHLAASQPGRVSALALLAPAHPYFDHADQLIAFYLSPLGRVFAHTLPWYPKWLQMIGLRSMAGPQSLDTAERLAPYRENLRMQGTVPFLLRLLRTWHSDMRELRHLLEAPFEVPTLLLWGDHDRAVPASTAPDLQRHLGASELQLLAGVGHRPAEERPAECARLIEEWWKRCHTAQTVPINAAG